MYDPHQGEEGGQTSYARVIAARWEAVRHVSRVGGGGRSESAGRRKAVEGEPDDPTLTQTAREADATLAVQTRQSFSNT